MTSLSLREPVLVMDLERLGSGFATRLSFMRTLVRRMAREQWHITYNRFDIDEQGYGQAVFNIQTAHARFSFVVFSQYLEPSERNDRVIAEKWDLTMTLVAGAVNDTDLAELAENVPLQEAGRINAKCMSLSRANRSARLFDSVLASLREGKQPDINMLRDVGYLYRTTAVYGSGKFGASDWDKLAKLCPDFATPFAAEMLVCYLIRQFSLDQLDHLVHQPAYPKAVSLHPELQRYLGIGNSTGLGMAPWLVNHPLVMNQWVLQRETALAKAIAMPVTTQKVKLLRNLIARACQHVREVSTFDAWQAQRNRALLEQMQALQDWFTEVEDRFDAWQRIITWSQKSYDLEAQELLVSLMIELFPEQVDELEQNMSVPEAICYDPTTSAQQLLQMIETSYAWALAFDFDDAQEDATFWYYSQNKIEPRLGKVATDDGAELQMYMGIAKAVHLCREDLLTYLERAAPEQKYVADFLFSFPAHQGIVPRIHTMSLTQYGEIRANLLHDEVRPMHLLRAKLANFGVSKFDPKSQLWVRNTMFQGAPRVADLAHAFNEDWSFPVAPQREHLMGEQGVVGEVQP